MNDDITQKLKDYELMRTKAEKSIKRHETILVIAFGLVFGLGIGMLCHGDEYQSCDCVDKFVNAPKESPYSQKYEEDVYTTIDIASEPGYAIIWNIRVDRIGKNCKILDQSVLFKVKMCTDSISTIDSTEMKPLINNWFNGDW